MKDRVQKLESSINQLKAQYDQYFLGVLKTPPAKLAENVAREVRTVATMKVQNTALQFKLQQIIARYNTFLLFWQRNLRDLEEGRTTRRKDKEAALVKAREGVFQISSIDSDRVQMESLYRKLSSEYKDMGRNKVPGLPKVREMVKQQTDQIKQKFNCESVEYRVVVEEGRIKIKANPVLGKE